MNGFQKLVLSLTVPILGYLVFLLMRRYKEDEDDAPPPPHRVRATAGQALIEMEVPVDAVGALIGRQGANIAKIQQNSGARLHMKQEVGAATTRTLLVRGTPEAAQLAEVLVRRQLAERPQLVTECVSVPQGTVRGLIGPNGATVRYIAHTSGAKVSVERGTLRAVPGSMVGVSITGTTSQIEIAKTLISSHLEEQAAMQAEWSTSSKVCPPMPFQSTNSILGSSLPATETACIPKERWPDNSDYVTVWVSSRATPSHFWVHLLCSSTTTLMLDNLRASMTDYYSSASLGQGGGDSQRRWCRGDVLAAPFPEDSHWYRAEVHSVLDDDRLDVTYIDYGDCAVVASSQARVLRADFWSLPRQAVECYAADIEAIDETWTDEACSVFDDIAHVGKWKAMMGRKLHALPNDVGEQVPCIRLVDTSGAKDVDITEELVCRGLARRKAIKPAAS